MNIYFVTLVSYSLLLIVVGLIAARRVKASSDFLVAGRKFGPGVIFATFLAANIGAGSTVGASGLGYRFGVSAWWWVGSASIGTAILSQFVGPKLWRIAKLEELHTLGDYLEVRYNKAVKGIIAIMLWVGTLSILAGQLIAISWILNVATGVAKWKGCLAGGIVAVTYCAAGGLVSSAMVNILELSVTMSGLLLAVPFAMHGLGGWQAMISQIPPSTLGNGAARSDLLSFTGAGARQIVAYVSILVPSFIVSPGLAQKLYGAKNESSVRWGVGLNSVAQACFAIVPALFGLMALSHFPQLENRELAMPMVLMYIVPKWIGLWALAAIFSAELSATDAILFMLSTSLSVDLYKTFVNPGVSQKQLLRVSRRTTVVAGGAGVLLAIALPTVISAVTIFYGLLAVALLVPLLLGLYWRRMNSAAAIVSIFTGVGVVLLTWQMTGGEGYWLLSPYAIGILMAFVAAVLVSWRSSRKVMAATRTP